jgi:hypothetical protein
VDGLLPKKQTRSTKAAKKRQHHSRPYPAPAPVAPAVLKGSTVRLNLDLDRIIHRKLKQLALDEDRSVADVVREADPTGRQESVTTDRANRSGTRRSGPLGQNQSTSRPELEAYFHRV